MKAPSRKGHPILFSVMMGVLFAVLVSAASAVSAILKFDNAGALIARIGAFLVMAAILTACMTVRGKSLSMFGFHGLRTIKARDALLYVPLLAIVLVQPLVYGINVKLTAVEVILIVLLSLAVGYTEESLFRGIMKEKLKSKGAAFYIVFSSAFFGILHIANALNGSVLYAVLQTINALLVGFILAELITAIDNIMPLIAFHFIYDALAQVSNENNGSLLTAVIILDAIYIVYAIFLLRVLKSRAKTETNAAIC